ncbi:hypothetical protein QMS75_17685 [Cronobacter sakazakii]|nr:hypothetical protein [Cronobacter sakazakii]
MANKKLSATITIGGAISSSLRGAFGTVKKSTTDIGSIIKSLSSEQRQLNEAMKRYGHSAPVMERLNSRYSTIVGQVERLRKAQERLNAVERASAANLAKRAELRGQIFDTVALGAVVAAPLKVAADRETHAVGIAKQLQGARDEAGKLTPVFWQMRKAVTDLGHEIPLACAWVWQAKISWVLPATPPNWHPPWSWTPAKLRRALPSWAPCSN